MFFHNKGFHYINLSSILHLDDVKNLFPNKSKIDESHISVVKTVRNKILNYKETVSSIDTSDHIKYGKDIVVCDCQPHNYFVEGNHDHVSMGDLRIITNSKLIKLVNKGPNFHEAMSINWNKCKREIEIELDLHIK